MAAYPRLYGDDLRNLLSQYNGDIQSIEFMHKAGYLSDAEYQTLLERGIASSSDFQGDIHDHTDLEGLEEIKEKEAELTGRIISSKLGISYEDWTRSETQGEERDELFDELIDRLRDAWWNDSSFYLCSYSPDRSQRVLIHLVQESNDALYDEDAQKIEVYKESFSKTGSSVTITCDDDSYTWYFLDERVRDDETIPGEISSAIRDFFSQVDEIGGGDIKPNGKEEQDTDSLLSAIGSFRLRTS